MQPLNTLKSNHSNLARVSFKCDKLTSIKMFYLFIYFISDKIRRSCFWLLVPKEEILKCVCVKSAFTFEGEGWAQCAQLCRCLVGVHAVAQGQLGNATAVLTPEVVWYRIVILCSVCEGLRNKWQKRSTEIKLQECVNDRTENNGHFLKNGASVSFQSMV